jgi:probable addiction module antidote protein
MALKLRKWDVVEHLKTDEDIALYLDACLEEAGDDAAFIAKARGDIMRRLALHYLRRVTSADFLNPLRITQGLKSAVPPSAEDKTT